MAVIKSSSEHLTLNADGAGKDIKFQANGVEKASISSAGAFTSTSIDATKLSGALPAIDGSALTGVGKVLQVVSTSITSAFSTTSGSVVDVTGFNATITPSSTTSKILVIVTANFRNVGSGTNNNYLRIDVYRDSTALTSNPNVSGAFASSTDLRGIYSFNKVDSPSSTAALVYKVKLAADLCTTAYINNGCNPATITLMEIGA